jgi:hypothetical protein
MITLYKSQPVILIVDWRVLQQFENFILLIERIDTNIVPSQRQL